MIIGKFPSELCEPSLRVYPDGITILTLFLDVLDEEPNKRSHCGKKLTQILRHIATFEDAVGAIGGLPSKNRNWRLE